MVAVPMNEITRGVRHLTLFTVFLTIGAIIISAFIIVFIEKLGSKKLSTGVKTNNGK
jgi:hypothetical protein